jgi:hypothetical protein
MATLFGEVDKQEDVELLSAGRFLNGFFPPKRIGGGPDPVVTRWRGRIGEHRLLGAIRDMRHRIYRNGSGPELTWGQLSEEQCKRVIVAELNGILREGER